jgi:hypothetical protein
MIHLFVVVEYRDANRRYLPNLRPIVQNSKLIRSQTDFRAAGCAFLNMRREAEDFMAVREVFLGFPLRQGVVNNPALRMASVTR